MRDKVLIVGAGVFGMTIELAKLGMNVTNDVKLQINTGLHRGYHYPTNKDTTLECLKSR